MRVGVLASGAGTNLQAILDRLHASSRDDASGAVRVVGVASDKPEAPALARAVAAGVPTATFAHDGYADRSARDAAMAGWMEAAGVELVVLAGYMQLLSPAFLARFPNRVVNVHPALLPAFPGLGAIAQALEYGVKVFGVTVHFVDDGVDSGRVILQRALELPAATDPAEVHAALRPLEHDLLCEAVALLAQGAVRLDPDHPRRVLVAPGESGAPPSKRGSSGGGDIRRVSG